MGCVFSWLLLCLQRAVLRHAACLENTKKRERRVGIIKGRPSPLLCFYCCRLSGCVLPLHIRSLSIGGTVNCSSTHTGDGGGYHTACCVPVGVQLGTPSRSTFREFRAFSQVLKLVVLPAHLSVLLSTTCTLHRCILRSLTDILRTKSSWDVSWGQSLSLWVCT